jgi:hypothetical protein
MSIWSDIEKRSAGDKGRQEDYNLIYGSNHSKSELVFEDEYKDYKYMISTDGTYPTIKINTHLSISTFSGFKNVILKDGDKTYNLMRIAYENFTGFFYECNTDDDFVFGPSGHNGHKYTLGELQVLAKKLIDLILETENKMSYMDD